MISADKIVKKSLETTKCHVGVWKNILSLTEMYLGLILANYDSCFHLVNHNTVKSHSGTNSEDSVKTI